MQTGGERAQIAKTRLQLFQRRVHDLEGLVGRSRPCLARESEVDGRGDELLLRAVVQVAFKSAALFVARLDDPGPDAASCSRASALARAAVTSSANPAIRCSVSPGNTCGRASTAMMAPQTVPATLIGAPTADLTPNESSLAASSPGTSW